VQLGAAHGHLQNSLLGRQDAIADYFLGGRIGSRERVVFHAEGDGGAIYMVVGECAVAEGGTAVNARGKEGKGNE